MPATATRKPNANGSHSALTPNTHPKAGKGTRCSAEAKHTVVGVGIEARWKANGTPHSNVGSNPTSARCGVKHAKTCKGTKTLWPGARPIFKWPSDHLLHTQT